MARPQHHGRSSVTPQNTLPKPIRGALVEVLVFNSAPAAAGTGSTDASGAYSVAVPANTTVFVRVKAEMSQTGSGATWEVSVRDNTQSDAIYVLDSPMFSSGAAPSNHDLHADSGWGGSSYTALRAAAPFALLDTVNTAMQKVLSVAPNLAFPELRVFWSINNRPAEGDTEAVVRSGTDRVADAGPGPRAIYVLGKEDVDTDEYDASPVIAHRVGHIFHYQSAFEPGRSAWWRPFRRGSPAQDQLVAPSSEGWGGAWSGHRAGAQHVHAAQWRPGSAQGDAS